MSEQKRKVKLFESRQVRAEWDAENEKWWFSVVDIVAILTESVDATAYWRKLKQRLKAEGNETVTSCHGLKMRAVDGKLRATDVADTEQVLRLIQSIPSKKAEPFKLGWLKRAVSAWTKQLTPNSPSTAPFRTIAAWVIAKTGSINASNRSRCARPLPTNGTRQAFSKAGSMLP